MAVLGFQDFRTPDWMLEEDPDAAGSFEVLPENWDAVRVFAACSTQWLRDARGIPIGLRYEGVSVVIERSKVADPDDAFMRIREMEQAAISEFRAQQT